MPRKIPERFRGVWMNPVIGGYAIKIINDLGGDIDMMLHCIGESIATYRVEKAYKNSNPDASQLIDYLISLNEKLKKMPQLPRKYADAIGMKHKINFREILQSTEQNIKIIKQIIGEMVEPIKDVEIDTRGSNNKNLEYILVAEICEVIEHYGNKKLNKINTFYKAVDIVDSINLFFDEQLEDAIMKQLNLELQKESDGKAEQQKDDKTKKKEDVLKKNIKDKLSHEINYVQAKVTKANASFYKVREIRNKLKETNSLPDVLKTFFASTRDKSIT